jgi:hypothetical protein
MNISVAYLAGTINTLFGFIFHPLDAPAPGIFSSQKKQKSRLWCGIHYVEIPTRPLWCGRLADGLAVHPEGPGLEPLVPHL